MPKFKTSGISGFFEALSEIARDAYGRRVVLSQPPTQFRFYIQGRGQSWVENKNARDVWREVIHAEI